MSLRTLTLKKETLADLSAEELGTVVGGTIRTKYDCTESYQVCNPLSREACVQSLKACIQTIRTCTTG
jgi:hypothetical protein